MCVCMYIYVLVYICVYIYLYVCVYLCIYVCVYKNYILHMYIKIISVVHKDEQMDAQSG